MVLLRQCAFFYIQESTDGDIFHDCASQTVSYGIEILVIDHSNKFLKVVSRARALQHNHTAHSFR